MTHPRLRPAKMYTIYFPRMEKDFIDQSWSYQKQLKISWFQSHHKGDMRHFCRPHAARLTSSSHLCILISEQLIEYWANFHWARGPSTESLSQGVAGYLHRSLDSLKRFVDDTGVLLIGFTSPREGDETALLSRSPEQLKANPEPSKTNQLKQKAINSGLDVSMVLEPRPERFADDIASILKAINLEPTGLFLRQEEFDRLGPEDIRASRSLRVPFIILED